MKKILFFVFCTIILSCNSRKSNIIDVSSKELTEFIYIDNNRDSCEYLYGYYRMSHKGTCKFCKERRKREYKEVVNELFNMQD